MADNALDAPRGVERATHNAHDGYGDPVTDSSHIREARAAIERVERAEEAAAAARRDRDVAIVRLHREDGMRPPQIARALNQSVSNVRMILRIAEARDSDD
jgi:DNA-directed RNA polymerase specialized sigma24 family protein